MPHVTLLESIVGSNPKQRWIVAMLLVGRAVRSIQTLKVLDLDHRVFCCCAIRLFRIQRTLPTPPRTDMKCARISDNVAGKDESVIRAVIITSGDCYEPPCVGKYAVPPNVVFMRFPQVMPSKSGDVGEIGAFHIVVIAFQQHIRAVTSPW